MNQEKIGGFILELRKEKNMTQKDLSDKLGITDRAVSKWENGRGMPDLSLLVPLCEILGVKVNELLSGERLDKKNYQDNLEKNIINTIDYTDKKVKKIKKIFTIILSCVFAFAFMILTMYSIDINRMRNNKPVLFSTWGYDYFPPIDIHEEELEIAITDYLVNKGDSEYKHYDNEKTFASINVYLINENNPSYEVYAWVLTEKYYILDGNIKKDTSVSVPYKFVIEKINDVFSVKEARTPRDGSFYNEDMKDIFPSDVRKNMDKVYKDGTLEVLELDIQKQTKLYFHI